MSNLEENDDIDEENTTNTKENTAKIAINAWRRRRSFENAKNPLLRRRLSQGEKMCVLYNSTMKQNYSSTLNRTEKTHFYIKVHIFFLFLACRDRLVRTPTVIVCKNYL